MVRRNIIAPVAVWEGIITREDYWLYSAGWLIHIIRRTRRRLYCNHIEMGTIKVYIIMKTCPSLLHNQCLSCERYPYLILLYLIWMGGQSMVTKTCFYSYSVDHVQVKSWQLNLVH